MITIDTAALRQHCTTVFDTANVSMPEWNHARHKLIHAVPTLLDRLEQLHTQLNAESDYSYLQRQELDQTRAALAASEARAERLQDALLKYGAHQPPCRLRYGPTMEGRCDCGLFEQLYPEHSAALAPGSQEGTHNE